MGRRRGKPRRSPLQVARTIASRLKRLSIRGEFDVETFSVEDTEWGNPKGSDFYWLSSANPTWVEFRARFGTRHAQEIESLDTIGEQFLQPLYEAGYRGRSIALVRTVIGEQGDQEWRSLTVTLDVRATLGQVADATRRWMQKPEYLAVTGFAVRIEL